MNDEGCDFPTILSDAHGTYQCRGWDRGGDNGQGYRQFHDWVPVGYFNVPRLVGGGPIEGTTSIRLGERADRQYVVRACRNCSTVWHQDITDRYQP